jgi:hypothetical protein
MKLTKGKLAKLLNKKKQTMKKNKKGKREKRGTRKTFRNRKHLNLMKKTLKKWSGGEDIKNAELESDKPVEEKEVEKEEFIVQQDESNIDPTSFLDSSKEREDEIDEESSNKEEEPKEEEPNEEEPKEQEPKEQESLVENTNVEETVEQVPDVETTIEKEEEVVPKDEPLDTPAEEVVIPVEELVTQEVVTPVEEVTTEEVVLPKDELIESIVEPEKARQENVSITINTTMDDLIDSVAKKVISGMKGESASSGENVDQKLVDASVTNAENASL